MLKSLLLSLIFISTLFGDIPTIKTMQDYPRSLAKDFYIWFYLKQNISSKQANELFLQVSHVSKKIYKAYAKRTNNKVIKKASHCLKLSNKELFTQKDASCVLASLKPSRVSKLSLKQQNILISRVKKLSPATTLWIQALQNKKKLKSTPTKNPNAFLDLFLHTSISYRESHFNLSLKNDTLEKLSALADFDKFVEAVARSNKLGKLQKSFVNFKPSKSVSTHARFYIGLIKIKQEQSYIALTDFMYVAKNDFLQMNRDKALFWSYLVTQSKHYLEKLYISSDLNIYTLYAAELLKKPFIGGYQPKLPSRITSLHDESDPFTWTQVLLKDNALRDEQACNELKYYENDQSQALYAFYLERCANYTVHPFVTPYIDEFKKSKSEDKALFYAIGRQESRLMAGGISGVFAMGMMQIMPFLSKAIAKQKREKLFLPDMFNPKQNIRYAKHHLKQLKRSLKHPLLMAYAYNGGQGYLRREQKTGLFSKNPKFKAYEPFLSMEMLSYLETREYGKKVLANYTVYSQAFKKPIVLKNLFDTLIK